MRNARRTQNQRQAHHGTAYLNLEAVARGLGFTRIADSGNEVVRWERVDGYLKDLGMPTCGHGDFIPENIFYRLAMKAKNEAAERFQAKIADEVIPSIRKHGAYLTPETLQAAILNPDYLLQVVTALKEETDKRKALEAANASLLVDRQIMQPKADYFDELVERNTDSGNAQGPGDLPAAPCVNLRHKIRRNFMNIKTNVVTKRFHLLVYNRTRDRVQTISVEAESLTAAKQRLSPNYRFLELVEEEPT